MNVPMRATIFAKSRTTTLEIPQRCHFGAIEFGYCHAHGGFAQCTKRCFQQTLRAQNHQETIHIPKGELEGPTAVVINASVDRAVS